MIERDLSDAMADAYQELTARVHACHSVQSLYAYVEGLDGALSPGQHRELERWIAAEASEPRVGRRWHVRPGRIDALLDDVVSQ